MGRGLYGQLEGWERRPAVEVFQERLLDNELVEGDHVENLKEMARQREWKELQEYVTWMRQKGWSKDRITSISNRAMAGVRL